jgi:uncharacterized protein YggE
MMMSEMAGKVAATAPPIAAGEIEIKAMVSLTSSLK